MEDLQAGMELKGTVLNVVDFGAFVDIGLKDSGLVHISQMANRYIKSPYDVVAVSDVITVWVLNVDKERKRVSLTMIQPGTERKPLERKPAPPPPPRQQRSGPPPRARRPALAQGQGQGPPPGRRPQPQVAGSPPPVAAQASATGASSATAAPQEALPATAPPPRPAAAVTPSRP